MKKTSNIVLLTVLALFLSIAVISTATAKNPLATTIGKANAVEKLTEAKLKVCQNKEAAIQKRNNSLSKMTENMLTKFESIATRVKTYYTGTVLPSGKTIDNYDVLVTEIASKKVAVRTALDKANSDASTFNCTSDDPKGQLTLYRTDMQAVKQALKDYRTSIKNLIVAVHSVTGTTESTSNSTAN